MEHIFPEDAVISRLARDSKNFPTSIAPALAEYLYRQVRETKPALVVEIGCYIGFSTLHIAKALKENGSGRLVSFDLNTGVASDNIKEARLSDYVEFIEGDSSVMGKQYLLDPGGEKIDFVFLDGDHTRRGCVRDFNVLHGHIRDGGYLLLHDIYPGTWNWKGPRLVLDYLEAAISRSSFVQFDIVERADLDAFGVAICRLISPGKNPLAESPWPKRPGLRLKTSKGSRWLELETFAASYQQYLGEKVPISRMSIFKMASILKKIGLRQFDRSGELKISHLKGRVIPGSIDFDREDSQSLLGGWYDLEGDSRFRYRWAEQVFSVSVPEHTKSLEMIAMAPPVACSDGNATMDVIMAGEKVACVSLQESQWRRYSIPLPRPITERAQCRFQLNRYYCPREGGEGEDVRRLGLAINKIFFVK